MHYTATITTFPHGFTAIIDDDTHPVEAATFGELDDAVRATIRREYGDVDPDETVKITWQLQGAPPTVQQAFTIAQQRKHLAAQQAALDPHIPAAVAALKNTNWSTRSLAALFGISAGRVSQIAAEYARTSTPHVELTPTSRIVDGITVYQIRAVVDMPEVNVARGHTGGWVQSSDNITGRGWVADDAVVYGAATISGSAVVKDNAVVAGSARVDGGCVGDDARVGGHAWVTDHAVVSGHAVVEGCAVIRDEAHATGCAHISGDAIVREYGTVDDYACISDNAVVAGSARVSGHGFVGGHAHVGGIAVVAGHAVVHDKARVDAAARVGGVTRVGAGGHVTGKAHLMWDTATAGGVVASDGRPVVVAGETVIVTR